MEYKFKYYPEDHAERCRPVNPIAEQKTDHDAFSPNSSVSDSPKLCAHCSLVNRAWQKGVTTQKYFLAGIEDPVFPVAEDPKHPVKNMRFVGRSMLNNNYRQPARLADMAAAQHGGQKGDLLVQHVDDDCMEGRETRYANVNIRVDVRKRVYRIVNQDVAPGVVKSAIQDLSNHVSDQYVLTLAEELSKACAGLTVAKGKHDPRCPDVLVLAPRCSDDPEFLTRLEHGCVARDKRVKMLVNNGQIRFGGVGEWTGSQCPLVVLTGFHQPYHLLNNVGCIGPERILAASRVEVDRAKILAKAAPTVNLLTPEHVKTPAMKVVAKAKELEETHADLKTKISKVPVDTLLYIAHIFQEF